MFIKTVLYNQKILPRGTVEIEERVYIPNGTYSIAFSKVN